MSHYFQIFPDRATAGRLTQHKQNWYEVGVGKLVTVEGDSFKDLLLLWREHKPAGRSGAEWTSARRAQRKSRNTAEEQD